MDDMGSVYQRRSDGRWTGKYSWYNPLTGKVEPKYVYSKVPPIPKSKWQIGPDGKPVPPPYQKGRQEATRKLYALIKKLSVGDISSASTLTVAGWMLNYLDIYCDKLAQTTKDGYRNYIINHINPILGNIKLKDLRPIHIERFYNHERNVPRYRTRIVNRKKEIFYKDGKPQPLMKDGKPVIGYSEKTILQIHRILNRAFTKAKGNGLMPMNPCESVDAPSPEEYEPSVYDADDYLLLLDKLKGHRMEVAVLIVGMCGLRRAEFAGLDWQKSFDLDSGIIRITETIVATSKGNKTKGPKNETSIREFAIPSAILPRLRELQGIGRVFTRLDGKDYNPGSISNMFGEFLKKNKLKHIRFHDLRHFNATMMLRNKVSDKEAAARLGHSDPAITRKLYQHVLKDMDQENADKLNKVFDVKL